jgi:integrase
MEITFAQAAAQFLKNGAERKKDRLRPNTLKTYRTQINTHLVPALGGLPVQAVGNKQVKELVANMAAAGISSATILLNFTIIKRIRKSVTNEDGDIVFPYEWNHDFIDLPTLETKKAQISAQSLVQAIKCGADGPLFAVLAASGLRIGEALAISLQDNPDSNYLNLQENKIVVRVQRDGDQIGPVKTDAGNREVDLDPKFVEWLRPQIQPVDGFVFPKTENAYRARLDKCAEGGFHMLRRFRTTHLNAMSCPTGLEYFWMGHAAKDVHSSYIDFGSHIETRKTEASRIGIGFQL